jgi:hypothetical protein
MQDGQILNFGNECVDPKNVSQGSLNNGNAGVGSDFIEGLNLEPPR